MEENSRINQQDRHITFHGSANPKEISQQCTPATHTEAVVHCQKVLSGGLLSLSLITEGSWIHLGEGRYDDSIHLVLKHFMSTVLVLDTHISVYLFACWFAASAQPSSLVTLLHPQAQSSLKITNRSFRYAAPHLWNKLPPSLRVPCQSATSECSPPSPGSDCAPKSVVGVLTGSSILVLKLTFSPDPFTHNLLLSLTDWLHGFIQHVYGSLWRWKHWSVRQIKPAQLAFGRTLI